MIDDKEDYTESFFGFLDTAINWINPIPFFESATFRQGFCIAITMTLVFACIALVKDDGCNELAASLLAAFTILSGVYSIYSMFLWAYC